MDSKTHVVIRLEFESDNPGVLWVRGPYDYRDAEIVANDICGRDNLERGKDIQVAPLIKY